MSIPVLESWDPRSLGALTETAMRALFETRGFAAARYVYPPETAFPPHTHDVDKLDGVLDGQLEIVTAEQRFVLAPGDWLFLPAGLVHSARVIGSEAVVSIDATRRG